MAASNAGPAVAISFAIAGLACAFAALCYAEFASTVPVAGSAYTFSYATFGELVAWIIGWDLALEFTIGAAALATGFSGYYQKVVDGTPFEVPTSLGSAAGGTVDLPGDRHRAAGDRGAGRGHQAVQPHQPGHRGDQARSSSRR